MLSATTKKQIMSRAWHTVLIFVMCLFVKWSQLHKSCSFLLGNTVCIYLLMKGKN